MHKKVEDPQKKVEEEKSKEKVSIIKSSKELHMKKSIMIKLFNTHQVQLIVKLVTLDLLVTVARLKNAQKTSLKSIPTLFMRLLRR